MIRAMDEKDLPAVMHIWLTGNCQAHSFIPKSYWEGSFKSVAAVLPQLEVYVAEENSEILGFIGFGAAHAVEGLFVVEQHRSKGVGKQLLDYAKKSRPRLLLSAYKDNAGAVSFYLRERFRVISEYTDVDTGFPAYVLEWRSEKSTVD